MGTFGWDSFERSSCSRHPHVTTIMQVSGHFEVPLYQAKHVGEAERGGHL